MKTGQIPFLSIMRQHFNLRVGEEGEPANVAGPIKKSPTNKSDESHKHEAKVKEDENVGANSFNRYI
jgi:hypothetical protein